MNTTRKITKTRAMLIHRGESTQIHFQVITPHNLRTMNAMVKRPPKPIPPLAVVVFSLIFLLFFANILNKLLNVVYFSTYLLLSYVQP